MSITSERIHEASISDAETAIERAELAKLIVGCSGITVEDIIRFRDQGIGNEVSALPDTQTNSTANRTVHY